jgi:non-ribosomal peptide synthetase component E (peptide arylation enzyme)
VRKVSIDVGRVWLEQGTCGNEEELNDKTALGFTKAHVEIEEVLWSHPGVQEVVVIVREDHPGKKQLVVYYVGKVEPEAFRGYLQAKLPKQMVPVVFLQIETLPLKPNGKVDRQALPVPNIVSD